MWKSIGLNVKLVPVENFSQVTDPAGTVHIRPWSSTHPLPDPLGSFVPKLGADSAVQINKQAPDRA